MRGFDTDVIVVGSGPAGATSALALATYGVDTVVLTKYGWTANTPRAHITNQGAMQVFRDLGVERDVLEKATPQHLMGDTVFCTSLAGEELARHHTWGTHPARLADYTLASPCTPVDIPQTLLEPILVSHAAARGARFRFNAEYLSHEQDEEGVTVTLRDRVTGREETLRSRYLIGADGGNSVIAEQLGLPMEGQMGIAGSMNIVVRADLTRYVAHRPSILYWVLQPGSRIGGVGMGVVRTIHPWDEWMIIWGYDIAQPPPEIDEEAAIRIVRTLVGDESLPVEVLSIALWGNNRMYATRYSQGRVFCMGDAVHRHPPNNGLGSNTSVQDAYNLAWKLAETLRGHAGPGLLASYEDERTPIGEQIVLRSNRSIEEFGPIFEAFGLLSTDDPAEMRRNMESRKEATPEGAEARTKLQRAIDRKNWEFNAHGVELGQRYRSSAVVGDGSPEPVNPRDPELYYQPTTWPGARLPHCWVVRPGATERVSTLDLAGRGRFALLTGIGGEAWVEAAATVGAELGIEIATTVIGPGRDVEDLYFEWARLREIDESGCLLVRPDMVVGWRSATVAEDCTARLDGALRAILDR